MIWMLSLKKSYGIFTFSQKGSTFQLLLGIFELPASLLFTVGPFTK
jgi:hypothetical protein